VIYPTPPPQGSCRGSLIVHLDGTPAGCTEIEDGYECSGFELRHESDPVRCFDEWARCDRCGIVR
jgi:hypothetical protein